uniref:Uncharacterized protein n=1 Tax=Rhizophora mucronata TaxID=61149 RepID=A0A2P2N1N3_RHIMU
MPQRYYQYGNANKFIQLNVSKSNFLGILLSQIQNSEVVNLQLHNYILKES